MKSRAQFRLMVISVLLCWAMVSLAARGAERAGKYSELARRGTNAMTNGNADEAIRYYNQALQESPPEKELWLLYWWRGLAYCAKNDLDSALKDWKLSLESNPPPQQIPQIYAFRGTQLLRDCRFEEGMADLERGAKYKPLNVRALVAYARSLFEYVGEYSKVMDLFAQATKLASEESDAMGERDRAYVSRQRAEIEIALEQYALASRDIDVALSNGLVPAALVGRARIALAMRDYSKAESESREALRLSPKDHEGQRLLGKIAWCKGDLKVARQMAGSITDNVDVALLDFSEGKTDAAVALLKQQLPRRTVTHAR